jgi:hypothetical protein
MERMIMNDKCSRFLRANEQLSTFLLRVENLLQGADWISAGDLQGLSDLVAHLGTELQNTSHDTHPGSDLQREITSYIGNLRSLQIALHRIHCIMLARKVQLDAERKHLLGLQGWFSAYHQIA